MRFVHENKKLFLLATSILCIFTMIISTFHRNPTFITNFISYIVVPSQKFTGGIGNFFSEKVAFISNLNEIQNENIELKKEIESLKKDNSRTALLEKDNLELHSLLETKQKYRNLPTTGANIIAKDNNNWHNSFIIDKGQKDGIEEKMIVITAGGLVGRISKVGINYAKVLPILDDSSSVGATSMRTGDFGFVKGDLELRKKGLVKMEFIDQNTEIVEGDEIITSNLSDIFPPGITIGYVKEVEPNNNKLTRVAILEPAVKFRNLDTVLVVTETFTKDLKD